MSISTRKAKGIGTLAHKFIVPDLAGPFTGGTVYNGQLLSALSELGLNACRLDLASICESLADPAPCYVWVDSLYLNELPSIRDNCRSNHTIGLLTHYLPSLVHRGANVQRWQLSLEEQRALDAADAFLVSSPFMRNALENLVISKRRTLVVEPGCLPPKCDTQVPAGAVVSAILVANLTPGKGIEPFLRELAKQVRPSDNFMLKIVGSVDLDKPYALACEQVARAHPKLSECVVFCGARCPSAALEEISRSNLFVSASVMETFGMALSEARTIGVPILAHAGGNVRAHLEKKTGGELVDTHDQLARSFLDLCRNQWALMKRLKAARQFATPRRAWSDAAKDYLNQIPSLDVAMLRQV
jgi:glycosyltransferase involved in cell wall biosynthesis